MEISQAVKIVKQGLDIALANGAFKSTEDVATIHTALVAVNAYILEVENSKTTATEPVLTLDSGNAKVSKKTK